MIARPVRLVNIISITPNIIATIMPNMKNRDTGRPSNPYFEGRHGRQRRTRSLSSTVDNGVFCFPVADKL
jgi:hypothetical protein